MPEEISCAAGCGMCCDPVHLHFSLASLTRWSTEAVAGLPDAVLDEDWAKWREAGWADEDRDYVKSQLHPHKDRRNADFAADHWHELLGPEREADYIAHDGGGETHMRRISCDAFDPHTRSCTVHDGGQPPICTGYPRYELPAGDPGISYGPGMSPACSYNADVRTMLPIVEVRTGR